MQLSKPYLFLTLGYPGSGKTFFSRKFAQEVSAVYLNSDEFRRHMFKRPKFSTAEHAIVFGAMNHAMEKILESGKSVILDANSNHRVHRREARRLANTFHADYLLIWIQTPLERAIKRAVKRDAHVKHRPVTASTVRSFAKILEAPRRTELHVIIRGTDSFAKQKERVLRYLKDPRL